MASYAIYRMVSFPMTFSDH